MLKVEPRTIYCCHFEFAEKVWETSYEGGIAEFMNGFWIDYRYQFTKSSEVAYWIPPARILYIEKLVIS